MARSVLVILSLCLAIGASAEQACEADSFDDSCVLAQGGLRVQSSKTALMNTLAEGLAETVKALDTATWDMQKQMDNGSVKKEDFQKAMGKWLFQQAAKKAMGEAAKNMQASKHEPELVAVQPEVVAVKPVEEPAAVVKPLGADMAKNMRNLAQMGAMMGAVSRATGHGKEQAQPAQAQAQVQAQSAQAQAQPAQKSAFEALGAKMMEMAKAAALKKAEEARAAALQKAEEARAKQAASMKQAMEQAMAAAMKAKAAAVEQVATKMSNDAAGKAQDSIDSKLTPIREAIDFAVNRVSEKYSKQFKLDENLHTKRTIEAMVDAALATWQNLRGEDNEKDRHEAIMRLIDELEMQSQPAALHHRVTHDVDRYLRGEMEGLANYVYMQVKEMTYNSVKTAGNMKPQKF